MRAININRRNKGRQNKPITAQVTCSGAIHTVTLKPSGALVLNNHSKAEQEAERALVALGAQPCECLKLLYLWRDPREWVFRWQFPEELKKEVWKNLEVRAERRRERLGAFQDLLRVPLEERMPRLTENLALRFLQKAKYRRSATRHDAEVRISWDGTCDITVKYVFGDGDGYGFGTKWVAQIREGWHRLYKLGAALVGGVFVLDLLEELPDGRLRVLAGRQGEGYDLYPQQALLTRKTGGGSLGGLLWSLRWLDRSVYKKRRKPSQKAEKAGTARTGILVRVDDGEV